jgi:iron(III) transport system ATP-binding protein
MVSISIENLSKRFGETVALDNVSLEIAAGELFFLLGPSGCGKTTLLRAIAGFHPPDSGRILFDDDDVTATPPHLRQTAMMFQSYALWPHMNVFKNVAFGLEERKVEKSDIEERVNRALEMVKMRSYADRKINQLSGGQQQRVALARALVVRPRALLLDEPLSNLDAKLRIEMRTEIRRICKEFGLTAIYVTHDQKEALSIADRIAILEDGKFAQVGAPEDVYRNPCSASVAGFIGETNIVPGHVGEKLEDAEFIPVETDLGTLESRPYHADWVPRTGEPVDLSIRPECLSLKSRRLALMPSIAGTLGETLYLGETAQYQLITQGRPGSIQISELNPRRVVRDIDSTFYAEAAPEDIVAMPASLAGNRVSAGPTLSDLLSS